MGCQLNNLNPITACNNPEGMIEKPFLFTKGTKFDTTADAQTGASWTTLIQSKDIIPLPSIKGLEPLNEGSVYEQTPYGTVFVRDGRMEMKVMIDSNSDLHKSLRSLKSAGQYSLGYAFSSGLIKMYQPVGTDEVHPFSLQLVNVEFQTQNDGSVGSKTPVMLTFADPKQHEDYPVVFQPTDFNAMDLNALYTVALEIVGTPTATEVVFDAKIKHINKAVESANPVEGLVVADVSFLTTAGAAQTFSGLTESATVPGRYTGAGTALETGTLGLVASSSMTTEGYEGYEFVTVTIA